QEEAALAGADLDVREPGEELQQPVARVVEDRAVVDHLVTQLANRPLRPRPAWEARYDRAARSDQLSHSPDVHRRVLDVVEVAQRQDQLVRPRDLRAEKVSLEQHRVVAEAREALPG